MRTEAAHLNARSRSRRAQNRLAAACLLLAWTHGPVARADDAGLAAQLSAALLPSSGTSTVLGAHVVDLSDGSTLFEHQATRPMIPASCMKLAVMSAAIDQLGRDYSFTTVLAVRNSDLVVIGSGDPTFGDERLADTRTAEITAAFRQWAARLKAAGIKQIPGNIIVDDFIFDLDFVHPNWPDDQYQAWYEAPIGGLNFNANCVAAVVEPTSPGQPAAVRLVPPNDYVGVNNDSRTGATNTVIVLRSRGSTDITLRGLVAKSGRLEKVTVLDPGLFFGATLKQVLQDESIPIAGKVIREKVRISADTLPADVHVVAIHNAPLSDVLLRSGSDSIGMMAEGLFKALGARQTGVGTWDSGRSALHAHFRKLGISANQVAVDDGSGLSREGRLSPAAMTRILSSAFRDEETFELLRNSLSVAGESGTMRKRLRGTDAAGRVFAKTGTIRGVRTLAGFAQTQADTWIAFAIFYNEIDGRDKNPRHRMDKACQLLVSARKPGPDAVAND